jgi:hypothetical protein
VSASPALDATLLVVVRALRNIPRDVRRDLATLALDLAERPPEQLAQLLRDERAPAAGSCSLVARAPKVHPHHRGAARRHSAAPSRGGRGVSRDGAPTASPAPSTSGPSRSVPDQVPATHRPGGTT